MRLFMSGVGHRLAMAERQPRIASVACLALAAATIGCGTSGVPTYAVRGTVTLDGMPLDGATVLFVPLSGPPNGALTDGTGGFSIASPGVPLGSCRVTVTKLSGPAPMSNPTPEDLQKLAQEPNALRPPKSTIPEKFGQIDTSGLTAEVTTDATKNVFTFDLKR